MSIYQGGNDGQKLIRKQFSSKGILKIRKQIVNFGTTIYQGGNEEKMHTTK